MTESSPTANQTPQQLKWLVEPYAERRILTGFLRPEEVQTVYPPARDWPPEAMASVSSLCGAGAALGPRPEAGQCRITLVEEPEALEVLDGPARTIQALPAVTFNFAWVEIKNLITAGAVSDPLSANISLTNDDLQMLARYSLYGYRGQALVENGLLLSPSPVAFSPPEASIVGNRLVVQYQIIPVATPIIVGYEQGRCFLLTEYGRVLHALRRNVERLLCLVYYGLDLSQVNMGVKIQGARGDVYNHFGPERLGGPDAPLVRDFLDPAVTAGVPSRAAIFSAQPFMQALEINIDPLPQGGLPLSGNLRDA